MYAQTSFVHTSLHMRFIIQQRVYNSVIGCSLTSSLAHSLVQRKNNNINNSGNKTVHTVIQLKWRHLKCSIKSFTALSITLSPSLSLSLFISLIVCLCVIVCMSFCKVPLIRSFYDINAH